MIKEGENREKLGKTRRRDIKGEWRRTKEEDDELGRDEVGKKKANMEERSQLDGENSRRKEEGSG